MRKHERPAAPASALAVNIEEAARRVGLSRSGFYKHYLNNHRLRAIPTGPQGRIIDVRELEQAYESYKEEWLTPPPDQTSPAAPARET